MQSAENNGLSIGIVDYLQVILNYRKIIIRITAAAFILSLTYSLVARKIYSSSAIILPPQQDMGMMSMMLGQMGGGGMANLAGDLLQSGKPADLYAAIMKTDALSDKIIDRFQLIELNSLKTRLQMYRVLTGQVKIEVGKKDGLISITVENKDPKLATDMANAYVEELGKLTSGLNITGAIQNKSFLEDRLARAKTDLARAEDALKAFQSRNKTISVTDQAKATIEGVAQLRAQLAIQEIQLATFRRQLTDFSQEVKTTKTSIENLKAQIAKLEGHSSGASAIPNVGAVPELGQEYARVMREFKIQEILVELLTKQYEMAKLTEANNVSTIQIIQKARIPDWKIKPKRAQLVIISTALAFFLAVLFAFTLNFIEKIPETERDRWNELRRRNFS